MFDFLRNVFGSDEEVNSEVDSVIKDCHGNYFVMRKGADSAIGVDADRAREQVRKLGGNPQVIDSLEDLP